MMEKLRRVTGISAVVLWFSSFVVWRYLESKGAPAPDPGAGLTWPLDTHGHVLFITGREHYLLYGLIWGGMTLFFLTAVLTGLKSR